MTEEKKDMFDLTFDWKPLALLMVGFSLGMIGMYYMRMDKEINQKAMEMCVQYTQEAQKLNGKFCYAYPQQGIGDAVIPDFSHANITGMNASVFIDKALE